MKKFYFLQDVGGLLMKRGKVKRFRLVYFLKLPLKMPFEGLAKEVADCHHPPAGNQQILAGSEVERNISAPLFFPHDNEGTFDLE